MKEVMIGAAAVLGVLVLAALALGLFMLFCKWRIRRIEEELERLEPGSVANLKAAKLCEELARRHRESED